MAKKIFINLPVAVEAGGAGPGEVREYGFMQQRGFEDPDGHLWEVLYLDMTKFPEQ